MSQPFVRAAHRLVVHLVGAVEHVHLDAERATEVLHRLRLTGTGGTRGGAAQHEPLRLRQGDDASIRQRRDDEAPGRPDVLVHVRNLRVAHVDLELPGLLVGAVAELRGPLERVGDVNLFVDELLARVSGVNVDCTQRQHLFAVELLEFAVDGVDDPLELVELLLQEVLHGVIVAILEAIERFVHFLGEDQSRDDNRVLCGLLKHPFGPRHLVVLGDGDFELREQCGAHRLHHHVEPLFHRSFARALLGKGDVFLLTRPHRDCVFARVAHLVGFE